MSKIDIFAFYGIDYEDQRRFQFYSRIIIDIGGKLLNATETILQNYKLSLPQLAYFAFIKMLLEEFINLLERTQHNI